MGTQVAMNLHSTVPAVGASGAIAGVLGAYFVLYPRARVLTWFFVFVLWVPAWIILGYWFVLNFLSGTATALAVQGQNMGGVAFWAHVGGFVSGALLVKVFGERRCERYPYAFEVKSSSARDPSPKSKATDKSVRPTRAMTAGQFIATGYFLGRDSGGTRPDNAVIDDELAVVFAGVLDEAVGHVGERASAGGRRDRRSVRTFLCRLWL